MSENVDYDVIIVGAGPAGSSLSIFLARQNKKVLLVDKSSFPRDKVCGECVSPGALNILEEIGIKEKLDKLNIEKIKGVTFRIPDLKPQSIKYPNGQHGYAISRIILDKLLIDHALLNNNVTLIESFNVKNVSIEKDKVIVSGTKNKEAYTYTAKILIGADGRYSTIGKLLNLYELKDKCEREVYVATIQGINNLDDTISLEIHSNRLQYLVSKQNKGLASIAVVINESLEHPLNKELFLETLKSSVTIKDKVEHLSFESQLKGIKLQSYKLKSLVDNRVMFIGDSVGFIDPITGEGMYRAFKTAKISSEIIKTAFEKNDFSKSELEVYQKELLKEFSSVYAFIKTAVYLTTNEKLAHMVINNMNNAKELGEKLVSLQGALIPGKELFSFNTLKLIVKMLKNQLEIA